MTLWVLHNYLRVESLSQNLCPRIYCFFHAKLTRAKLAKCIKGLIWPPLEAKNESCFLPISSDCIISVKF